MDATEIKTRHGLILQGLVGASLAAVGYALRENWQYAPEYETPDFTIPDDDQPQFIVEVHQTDARNSFQMKVLRAFSAVCEAKCFFGDGAISVNILFGDPDAEVPESNVRALFAFFDVNIVPRKTNASLDAAKLESHSLRLAGDESYDVTRAVLEIRKDCAEAIKSLGRALKDSLDQAAVKTDLFSLWCSERTRLSSMGACPAVGSVTHYKKSLLQSLFLSDDHFEELRRHRDPNKVSAAAKRQLRAVGLVSQLPFIAGRGKGPRYRLVSTLADLVFDTDGPRLRSNCEHRIDDVRAVESFFSDIRSPRRRQQLARAFVELLSGGRKAVEKAIVESLETGTTAGITHARCWVADFMPLVVDASHNSFNRRMFQHPAYTQTLGNPFNNITIRSPRLGRDRKALTEYAKIATDVFFQAVRERRVDLTAVSPGDLADKLAVFRIGAAVKLQKLNPLYLEVESVCRTLGVTCDYRGSPSFLSDVSDPADPVGKYDLFVLTKDNSEVLLNALYIGENYGSDHKADEWSARRRSLGYRLRDGAITPVERKAYVMVLDGVWTQKSVTKLHAAGWTHVCRLPDLHRTLTGVFSS
jgi:hypothetical protein